MWQTPNRNAGTGTKKRTDRTRNRIPVQMKRIRGELRLVASPAPATVVQVRVILNDLSPRGVGLFSQSALQAGQEIELSFEDPIALKLHGRVVWSHEHQVGSHILSQTPFTHRAGVQFLFKDAEQEATLKRLCEDLIRDSGRK